MNHNILSKDYDNIKNKLNRICSEKIVLDDENKKIEKSLTNLRGFTANPLFFKKN